jgi:hypothetical protein
MPTIAVVHGILIAMYANDHDPPHFHARWPDGAARVGIADGRILDHHGRFHARTRHLLQEWAAQHRAVLMQNWMLARAGKPLKRIDR